jgi:hypothetical protein
MEVFLGVTRSRRLPRAGRRRTEETRLAEFPNYPAISERRHP